jgi:hypothetical protein
MCSKIIKGQGPVENDETKGRSERARGRKGGWRRDGAEKWMGREGGMVDRVVLCVVV